MKKLTFLGAALALVLAATTAIAQPYGYGMMGGYGYGPGLMYGYGSHSGSGYGPGMMYGYRYNYRSYRNHHGRHYYNYGYGMMGPGWYGGDGR